MSEWETYKISDVYAGLYDGPHATPPDSDEGAVFLGISNITKNGHIDLTGMSYMLMTGKRRILRWMMTWNTMIENRSWYGKSSYQNSYQKNILKKSVHK